MDKSLIIGSFARHILTTLGGMAVAKGWLDSSQIEPVAGALLVLAGVAWSLVHKRTAK